MSAITGPLVLHFSGRAAYRLVERASSSLPSPALSWKDKSDIMREGEQKMRNVFLGAPIELHVSKVGSNRRGPHFIYSSKCVRHGVSLLQCPAGWVYQHVSGSWRILLKIQLTEIFTIFNISSFDKQSITLTRLEKKQMHPFSVALLYRAWNMQQIFSLTISPFISSLFSWWPA